LYAEILTKKGHRVTGIDFSKNSIDYARAEAEKKGLSINYMNDNYLNLNENEQYDLIIQIFTDFGVLLPKEREQLLLKVYNALKPGGLFIFDVLNNNQFKKATTAKNWEVEPAGFWSERPYLVLSDSFSYSKEQVVLYQHLVIEDKKKLKVYRFWTHFFSDSDLQKIVSSQPFCNCTFHKNVLPESDMWNGKNVTFSVMEK
jgi:2-polyprenyl-3-methyl-5-hydroxy-6-metoxy-1,4-benzoquinol methylase